MTPVSCIYTGHVRHRRFTPVQNRFRYRLYMMYLDLEELPGLFGRRWLWSVDRPNVAMFRRADYLGDASVPLDEAVRATVADRTGRRPPGPIRMLTHLRTYGYLFNPVTLYFCFDEGGETVETIVAQITNTPWKQRHAYVLSGDRDVGRAPRKRYQFDKQFHISPFNPMDLHYDWRFSHPGDTFNVHMMCAREGRHVFDATLRMRRRELSSKALASVLLTYPFMTWKVTGMIYWQAFRLWAKRAPYYPNPSPP